MAIFYGTKEAGGFNGAGTVFKITPAGMLAALYSFRSQSECIDGGYPLLAPVRWLLLRFLMTSVARARDDAKHIMDKRDRIRNDGK
jgi:uncharacterized repeat protein (TIGR03803 family)